MNPAVTAALAASTPLARHIASRPIPLGWLSQLHKHACKGDSLSVNRYQGLLLGYLTAMADHNLMQWRITQQAMHDLQSLAATWEQFGQ
jgi:hypothetical protein